MDEYIANCLIKIWDGVLKARAATIPAEYPDAVQFEVETEEGLVTFVVRINRAGVVDGKIVNYSWSYGTTKN